MAELSNKRGGNRKEQEENGHPLIIMSVQSLGITVDDLESLGDNSASLEREIHTCTHTHMCVHTQHKQIAETHDRKQTA